MATNPRKIAGFIAANRYGFGARLGELKTITSDPRGWLRQALTDTSVPNALRELNSTEFNYNIYAEAKAEGAVGLMAYFKGEGRQVNRSEVAARTRAAVESDSPFRERLVQFWSNHFTVSSRKAFTIGICGSFEREVIRPNVTGRFVDMLLASSRHPAMIIYLDNINSLGPKSRLGRNNPRGLNENLAREILELHTLGVDGGYLQDDVRALAKLITGWSVGSLEEPDAGQFRFRVAAHEPGSIEFLGHTYKGRGEDDGIAALRQIAAHPSTARFIATKLARHFVADEPPARAIATIEKTFRDTAGDLGEIAQTLIDLEEAWQEPLPKFKSPNDLIISTFRALGSQGVDMERVAGALWMLRQYPFSSDSPAGWPDTEADWLTPQDLMRRVELARTYAPRIGSRNARRLAEDILEPVLSPSTIAAMDASRNRREVAAVFLASPEFQRR